MSVNQYNPSTGQLTPVVGTNNHLKDEMVAPYEATTTASRAYAVGDQFIYNQTLYTVTEAIAQGGTIVPYEVVGTVSFDVSYADNITKVNVDGIEYTDFTNIPVKQGSIITLYQSTTGYSWRYLISGQTGSGTILGAGEAMWFVVPDEAFGDSTIILENLSLGGADSTGVYFKLSTNWGQSITSATLGEGVYVSDTNCRPSSPIVNQINSGFNSEIVAPVEKTSTSAHNYAIDDQFIYNNNLYKAIKSIAIGDLLYFGSNNFVFKIWNGLAYFLGTRVWNDGENIYYSYSESKQYILDTATNTWVTKTWNEYVPYNGEYIWTDGDNIYFSYSTDQYVLDKATSTWNKKTWTGLTDFYSNCIWTDGANTYYSNGNSQYVLDKSTSTWSAKTWKGLTSFRGQYVWTDGNNIYFSYGIDQYVLDKTTSTWSGIIWNGLTDYNGDSIWSDGTNTYYSYDTNQYVLNRFTNTWEVKTWNGLKRFYGKFIWNYNNEIYYSNSYKQFTFVRDNCVLSDPIVDQLGKGGESGIDITYADWLQLSQEERDSDDYYIWDVPVNSSILPISGYTMDSEPTVGSYNPVTSNGIAEALIPINSSIQSISGSVQSLGGRVTTLENNEPIETEGVNKIIGDTSVTFTNSAIKTTSELHLLSENTSNMPVFYTAVSVSSGSATYTFPALTEATTFYLVIK